jgi:hypothetical protein
MGFRGLGDTGSIDRYRLAPHCLVTLMNLVFWLLLNVAVPVGGPLFTLALIAPTHGSAVAKKLVFESVKDGQMFWSAIALSAAAIYESAAAIQDSRAMPEILMTLIVIFGAIAFSCSIVAMMATTKAHALLHPSLCQAAAQTPVAEGSPAASVLVPLSLLANVAVAVMFGGLHAYLSG